MSLKIDWTKVNWNKVKPFKAKATYGETLGPAMKITDPKKAEEYFIRLVAHYRNHNPDKKSLEELVQIAGSNLGYFAGYYDAATAARVHKVFDCSHPIFGKTIPTAEEAFNAGMKLGKKALTSAGK